MSHQLTVFRVLLSTSVLVTMMFGGNVQAKSYSTDLSAFVPTSCSASMQVNVAQFDTNTFSLGSINQFCNTRFQLALTHGQTTTSGQLQIGGRTTPVNNSGSTILKSISAPVANIQENILIAGVNETDAVKFASNLTVTISPIGF